MEPFPEALAIASEAIIPSPGALRLVKAPAASPLSRKGRGPFPNRRVWREDFSLPKRAKRRSRDSIPQPWRPT